MLVALFYYDATRYTTAGLMGLPYDLYFGGPDKICAM